MTKKTAIIIGAGPAGLTAAYELLDRTDVSPVVLEESDCVGGISRTVCVRGNRVDIGGHRFFSKSDRVMEWWLNILPLQGAPARDDIALGRSTELSKRRSFRKIGGRETLGEAAPDPETADEVMLSRSRLSRIFFLRKFFDYPLKLNLPSLANLGLARTARIAASYVRSQLFPRKKERSLEDFFINRFGEELYRTFFKSYTEKVWGVSCTRIKPEWGAQRVKGLSVARAVLHAFRRILRPDRSRGQKGTETSLIERFLYPKFGPGQMWDAVARAVTEAGGTIRTKMKVVGMDVEGGRVVSVRALNLATGSEEKIAGDYFISTMPVRDLVAAMARQAPGIVPAEAANVAAGLSYRDFMTVGLTLKKLSVENRSGIKTVGNIIPDNWIYVQERDVRIGRIQIFNNWSPYMAAGGNVLLGLEYFCNEGDALWTMEDGRFADFAVSELEKIGFARKDDVLDSFVVRMKKAYPGYFGSYERFEKIREFTDGFHNLFLIGRNGMHRYNNQDHSMLTAMAAVDNIAAGSAAKDNIWSVNAEEDYLEKKITAVENLTESLLKDKKFVAFRYDPDGYWKNAEDSYSHYPTVRHRKRYIIDAIARRGLAPDDFVFDYGCGEGGVLKQIASRFGRPDGTLGGCDISARAVESARGKLPGAEIHDSLFPEISRRIDVAVCSEVIEHTENHLQILGWLNNNIRPGGVLILTTQAGKIHASDIYTGHRHHFELGELTRALRGIGFEIADARLWGFPFFTAQKYLTDVNFEKVRRGYLEGEVSPWRAAVFSVAYALYFVHDFIRFGPQIYITAVKKER